MVEITHRQLRNESGDVLRRVAAGETIMVTNHGQPAAIIGPPNADVLEDLAARGRLRPALADADSLGSIRRTHTTKRSDQIVSDIRGNW